MRTFHYTVYREDDDFVAQKGSHAKYRDPHGHTVIVPHPRKHIPIGTLRSMIRQSGLPSELFE